MGVAQMGLAAGIGGNRYIKDTRAKCCCYRPARQEPHCYLPSLLQTGAVEIWRRCARARSLAQAASCDIESVRPLCPAHIYAGPRICHAERNRLCARLAHCSPALVEEAARSDHELRANAASFHSFRRHHRLPNPAPTRIAVLRVRSATSCRKMPRRANCRSLVDAESDSRPKKLSDCGAPPICFGAAWFKIAIIRTVTKTPANGACDYIV